jgi:hypothetical protein
LSLGFGCRVKLWVSEFRDAGLGSTIWGLRFGVYDVGFRVKGLGLRVDTWV